MPATCKNEIMATKQTTLFSFVSESSKSGVEESSQQITGKLSKFN